MVWIAGTGAVLCLVYYGVIVCSSGISTSFAWFWPAAGIFLGALAAGALYGRHNPKKIPLWMSVSAVTFLVASLVIFCVVEVLIFLGAAGANTPNLDYVIVLGAKVEEGRVSNSLQMRLDRTVEYCRRNPDTVFVLSGGKGKDEPASEASVMYEYLKAKGVPEAQMVLEERSESTVENIAYSKVLIDEMERGKDIKKGSQQHKAPGPYMEVEDKPIQIGVLTSNFHVFRAVRIGKKCGIEGIYGIGARSDAVLFVHLCVRECAAILKDKLMGNM